MINFLQKLRGSKICDRKGTVALMSMLIIAAFTLILTIAATEASIATSYQFLNRESSDISYYSSEGCLDEALIRIEESASFSGETLTMDDSTCTISVTGTNPKTISVNVNYGDYSENFRATVNISNAGHAINTSLSTWEEI